MTSHLEPVWLRAPPGQSLPAQEAPRAGCLLATSAESQGIPRLFWSSTSSGTCRSIDRQAAVLFFQLISRGYERGPMILTSNHRFDSWNDVVFVYRVIRQ